MAIEATSKQKIHWNYFLALEQDMERVARYVEFSEKNFKVYSLELAHLLFAASSEMEVVSRLLCKDFHPDLTPSKFGDMGKIRAILMAALPLHKEKVFIPRYGLTLTPFKNWGDGVGADWWSGYNAVKHNRDSEFEQATLENALNSLGGLFILANHHCRNEITREVGPVVAKFEGVLELKPKASLLRLVNQPE